MRRAYFLTAGSAAVLAVMLVSASAQAQSNAAIPPDTNAVPPDPVTTSDSGQVDAGVGGETADADIVVTGFRRSLAKGLELKREAVGVRDSIVAEDIGKFPEANVADSLQRIPGVFLTRDGASNEGQRISIRGLGSEFTVTTINGAPVRTTSSQNVGSSTRDFNYDVFPSELFGRVDVYKTPLAQLEEGGIAGNVDLQTPRPFDSKDRVIRYTAQANYNTQSKQWRPRGSLLVSNTWGNFGALFGIAYAKNVNERSGFQSTGGYNSSVIGSRAFAGATTQGGPFNYQLDLANPNARFGALTRDQVANGLLPRFYRVFTSNNERERLGMVGSLQYKGDRLELSVDGIFSRLTDSADEFTFGAAVRNSRTVAGTAARLGTGTNSGIYPIDVRLDAFNNLSGTFGNTSFIGESFFRDAQTDFRYGIVRGSYDITDTLKLKAQGNLSESNARYSANRVSYNIYGIQSTFDPTPNVTYPTISSPVDFTSPANYSDAALAFTLNREIDKERTGRVQLDWALLDTGERKFSMLLGGSYVSTAKEISQRDGSSIGLTRNLSNGATFAQSSAGRLANGTSSTSNVFALYMDPFIQYGRLTNGGNAGYPSQFATFQRGFVMDTLDANGANEAAAVRLNQAFRAEEIVKSAFFETSFHVPIFDRPLRGNVGVRYADTITRIDNYASAGAGVFAPNFSRGGYENWLPSASFSYDVLHNVVLRASAAKTITRAALGVIAGSTVVPNVFSNQITVGNPNIQPQTSAQADLGAEWYFAPGALIGVGAFKKTISDVALPVIDTIPFSATGLPSNAFNSSALIGILDAAIPADFPIQRSSYVNSGKQQLTGIEVSYSQNYTFLPKPFDGLGFTGSFTIIDRKGENFVTTAGTSVAVAAVPDYSYSATLFYEKGPFTVRGSYNYRAKTGPGSGQNTGNDQIAYVAPQGFLDATASFRVADWLELRVDALNLTNENLYIYYENPDQPKGNGQTRRDNSFFNGTTLSFGIRGKF